MAAYATTFLLDRARGGVSFDSADSTVKITHYAEVNNASAFGSKNVAPPPLSGSMPVPGSYQYSKVLNLNGGSSSASASLGAITNSQNVGVTFSAGTGLTQTDPSNAIAGPAQLKFQINQVWNVDSHGFGPTAYGYVAFTLGGVIPSGDNASFTVDLSWTNASNTNLRAPLHQTVNFPSNTLPYTFSNAAILNTGSVTSGQIKLNGTITFQATDPGQTIDLHPTDFEMSAAPPTCRFLDHSFLFFDPLNWTNDMGIPGGVPNTAGARAYFGPTANPVGDVLISNQPEMLGTLDINRPGMTFFGNAPIIFATSQANNAVLLVRNTNNFTGQAAGQSFVSTPTLIGNQVVLMVPTEVIVDTEQPLNISEPISGSGGIIKSGLGELQLSSSNSFTGGIAVDSGTLTARADGALGSNTITLNGGMINIQTPHPFGPGGGTIGAQAGGQVNIGTSGITGVSYSVGSFGAISGSGQQLGALVIGSNFFPQTNSMISHQTFDPGIGASNPQGLTNTPLYIFGISNDFTSAGQSIQVGSTSGTPWSGFGSDNLPHVFGGALNQELDIIGIAQLTALGGSLKINAPINGNAASQIIKSGAGLIAINSPANTFLGPTDVQGGPLAVNSSWNGPITVESHGSLGGTGNINAPVTFNDDPVNPTTVYPTFQPGTLGAVAFGAGGAGNTTPSGPGTITTGDMIFSPQTHLMFDLDQSGVFGGPSNDLLIVNGNLTLEGILDVNAGADFTVGLYPLITYTGTLTDYGLQIGNFDFDTFPDAQIVVDPNNSGPDGTVFLAVPEPGMIGLLALAVPMILSQRGRRSRLLH
jgi:autotransporter-associated beta strand protein